MTAFIFWKFVGVDQFFNCLRTVHWGTDVPQSVHWAYFVCRLAVQSPIPTECDHFTSKRGLGGFCLLPPRACRLLPLQPTLMHPSRSQLHKITCDKFSAYWKNSFSTLALAIAWFGEGFALGSTTCPAGAFDLILHVVECSLWLCLGWQLKGKERTIASNTSH